MATDLRPLHLRALSDVPVSSVEVADLDRPTPCAGWDLGALLSHMVGQHYGFALAVSTGDAAVADYDGPGGSAALAGWAGSVERLTSAFAAADLSAEVRLVEISPELRFPAGVAIGFQLLDTVIHAWDVATALGLDYRPDSELVGPVLALARRVPGGEARSRPGAAFGAEVSLPADSTDPWLAALALLGRRPA